jgi:selenocysteine-specific elongation factor
MGAVMQIAGMAGLVRAAGMLFSRSRWDELAHRLLAAIDEMHAREPEMPGLEIHRARRIAAPSLEPDAFSELIDALVSSQAIVRRGAFIARPSHRVELSSAERHLWESIAPLLDDSPYNPPRVRDIAKITNIPEAEIRANLRRVARIGEVSLVALDHFFLSHRVAEMAEIVQELFEAHGAVRAAEFRDRIGGGRKVAIQILEFFDRVGYTRRLRDDHLVRQSNPFAKA